MVAMIDEALGKRRSYGEPSARAPTLKGVRFVKKWVKTYGRCKYERNFNKLSIFAFGVYNSRSFSAYAI